VALRTAPKNTYIRPVAINKFKLETWYDPEGEPTVEYFTSLKECSQLAASRSKEGLTVVIERVIESQETF